jgi:hypothetical protein
LACKQTAQLHLHNISQQAPQLLIPPSPAAGIEVLSAARGTAATTAAAAAAAAAAAWHLCYHCCLIPIWASAAAKAAAAAAVAAAECHHCLHCLRGVALLQLLQHLLLCCCALSLQKEHAEQEATPLITAQQRIQYG